VCYKFLPDSGDWPKVVVMMAGVLVTGAPPIRQWGLPISEGDSETLYFFYMTCPKCAKHYGKNYVVAVAKVK
jgi:hypothetical protein